MSLLFNRNGIVSSSMYNFDTKDEYFSASHPAHVGLDGPNHVSERPTPRVSASHTTCLSVPHPWERGRETAS